MRKRLMGILFVLAMMLMMVPFTGKVAHAGEKLQTPTELSMKHGICFFKGVSNSSSYMIEIFDDSGSITRIPIANPGKSAEGLCYFDTYEYTSLTLGNSYCFTVYAMGDDTNYENSDPATSASFQYKGWEEIGNPHWEGNTACWDAYDGADKYWIYFYKDGSATCVGASGYEAKKNSFDATEVMEKFGAGSYTFTVTPYVAGEWRDDAKSCNSRGNIFSSDIADRKITLEYTKTTYDGFEKAPGVTVEGLTQNVDFEVEYENFVNAGTAKVIITGTGSYTGTVTKTYTIEKYVIKTSGLKLKNNTLTYTGKKQSVKLSGLSDLAVAKATGNSAVNVGSYIAGYTLSPLDSANMKMDKSKYTFTWKIVPAIPKIKTLTPGFSRLTFKASTKPAAKGASTYQIAYRQKGTNVWKYTTTTSESCAIKGLKKGKCYFVKVRAYKKVLKKTYYSEWSKAVLSQKVK